MAVRRIRHLPAKCCKTYLSKAYNLIQYTSSEALQLLDLQGFLWYNGDSFLGGFVVQNLEIYKLKNEIKALQLQLENQRRQYE